MHSNSEFLFLPHKQPTAQTCFCFSVVFPQHRIWQYCVFLPVIFSLPTSWISGPLTPLCKGKKTNIKCRCHQWTDALKAEEGFSLRDLTMFSIEAGQFFPVSVESTSLLCDILMDQIFSKNSVFVNVPVVNILTCHYHRCCTKVGLHCALKSGESKIPALSSCN